MYIKAVVFFGLCYKSNAAKLYFYIYLSLPYSFTI